LHEFVEFLPVTPQVLMKVSDIWAKSRLQGQAMANGMSIANGISIDVDAIICAH